MNEKQWIMTSKWDNKSPFACGVSCKFLGFLSFYDLIHLNCAVLVHFKKVFTCDMI